MIYQAPAGARDLLPLEVAQKSSINDSLQQVFSQWGYQRIVTSTLEWVDTLMAGGAIEASTVIQLQNITEGALALRPELTASIARTAVTRMADNTYPQRLCYRANVFRNPPLGYHGRQLEFFQAGVELLFASGVLADGEILLLIADSLHQLGLEEWQIILGEIGLTESILNCFPPVLKPRVRHCIANLDYLSLENLPLSDSLKELALQLFDLRGKPETVLEKVVKLDLDESGQRIVNNLRSLVELVQKSSTNNFPLILDLSLLRPFDYYTGMVFDVVSQRDNQLHILGQGGRYDQLLGVYHPQGKSAGGIGFAFNIEDLHACLLAAKKLPQQVAPSDWLIIPETTQAQASAFIYAQKLRISEPLLKVELDLGDKTPEEIREYAQNCHIQNLAWVKTDGTTIIEDHICSIS